MLRLQAVEAPLDWSHAALGDLQLFLKEQALRGAWHPKFNFGLWTAPHFDFEDQAVVVATDICVGQKFGA